MDMTTCCRVLLLGPTHVDSGGLTKYQVNERDHAVTSEVMSRDAYDLEIHTLGNDDPVFDDIDRILNGEEPLPSPKHSQTPSYKQPAPRSDLSVGSELNADENEAQAHKRQGSSDSDCNSIWGSLSRFVPRNSHSSKVPTIDQYELLQVIGMGSWGKVILAR